MGEERTDMEHIRRIGFYSVYIEITSRCNGRCPYCYNDSGITGSDMPYSKIKEVMAQAYEINRNVSFTFSGGEPFMHPDIAEMIDFGCSLGSDITVITNGSLLGTLSSSEQIYQCSLQVTLDTLDETLQDSMRGTGSFRNIKNLQRYLPNINHKQRILRINLTRDNLMDIREFTEFAVDNAYTEISFGFPVGQGRAKGRTGLLDFDNRDDWDICFNAIREVEECAQKYKDKITVARKNCYPRLRCELTDKKKPTMALRITPDGNVYPCLYFGGQDNSLGNINHASLDDILRDLPFRRLIRSLLYRESHMEACRSCIWNKYCFKGCPALAYSKYGSLDHKISCAFLDRSFSESIKEKAVLFNKR